MEFEIKKLRKKDAKKAISFAIEGMHFHWYTNSKLLLNLYGRYFWYLEVTRATQIIAVYTGDQLAGILLAEIKGEQKKYHSFGKSLYIKIFHCLQSLFVKGGVDVYDQANKEMFLQYCNNNNPDGEILFLAANPKIKTKGIGSILLKELERREQGKTLYLYTDNACTYQFYEHRGFDRVGEKRIVLKLGHKKVPLQCFLYHKVITGSNLVPE